MVIYWSLLAGIYLLDFATKQLVRMRMPVGSEISILPFFSLTHIKNTGIAFGLFQERNMFFVALGLVVISGIVWFGLRQLKESRFDAFVLAAVAGGAFGNLTDRIVYGRVTDFLDFYVGTHHWPAFNVADSAICVGAGLLLLQSFRRK